MKASLWKGFLALLVVLAVSVPASAAITLYDNEGTTFSTDGSFNTFYVYSSSDNEISGTDHDQSRIKMGFLPNWIGFNFSKQVGDLKLGGRSSFWVTINDSDNLNGFNDPEGDGTIDSTHGLTDTGIDVRQFYGTVDADWGQVLFGKDFTLFNRSNIFLDEILLGYGNVSDTLGLIDGANVSFGNIGTGYTYPMPSAQITYRTPDFNGFKLAIGLIDPSRTAAGGEENLPRLEGEATYKYSFDGGSIHTWVGFLTQSSEDSTGTDVDSNGVSYGVQVAVGNARVHASGFTADGVGFLLGPGVDTTLGLPVADIDSSGYLFQGAYILGPARLVASYGKNELEAAPDWENETITGACFYSINDNLQLVAEYNVNTIEIGGAEEETNTIALGAVLNF